MTVNILAFLCKAPHLSHAQFKDYYEQKHMPLVIQITGDAHPVVYKRRFMNHESAVAKPTKEVRGPCSVFPPVIKLQAFVLTGSADARALSRLRNLLTLTP